MVDVTGTVHAFAADTGLNEERSHLIRSIDHRLESAHGGIWFWCVFGLGISVLLQLDPALAAGVILGEYVAQPVMREARRVEARLAGPRLVGVTRVRRRRRGGGGRSGAVRKRGEQRGK